MTKRSKSTRKSRKVHNSPPNYLCSPPFPSLASKNSSPQTPLVYPTPSQAIAAGRVRVKGRFARRDDSPEEESEDEGAVPPPPTAPPAAFYPVVLPLPVPATLSLPAPRHSEGQSEGLAPRTASPSPSLGGVETPTGGPGLAAGPASPTRLSIGCTATSEAL